MENHNYLDINKQTWNNKVDIHVNSDFYKMDEFLEGNTSLNDIELELLGNIEGKKILHLQCHFGQDTISLARMGAHCTGVDLSDKAIEKAISLTKETQTNCQFICCDIFDLEKHLDTQFDLVFSSYGTIGWLPDLSKWASIVSKFLKPGGQFVFAEFHPAIWMFSDDFSEIKYKYFRSEAIIEEEIGTYADTEADLKQSFVMWNHGLADVVQSLIKQDLEINHLEEFDYSPYNIFPESTEEEPKQFRIKKFGDKLPLVYALRAKKK